MSAWEGDVDPVSKTRRIFLESGFDTLPARFNVDFNDIKEGEKIGDGLWGPVLKAEWLGRKVAVKKFNRTSQNVLLMAKEVKPMLNLRHPNILKLFGFYLLAQADLILQCSMVMELMDCDLNKYIEKRRGIQAEQDGGRGFPSSDDEGLYIIAEIARGMNHMHECRYFHRDLKPENVFIKRSEVSKFHVDVKIADFGTSGIMGDSNCDRNYGTLRHKAPELFDPTATLKPDKIDVFSFGVLCSKILTGEEPYGHLAGHELKEHIRNGATPEIPDGNLPDDVVGVIKQCLNTNPEARPDFHKICSILEPALEKVRKTRRSVTTSGTTSSHPEELEPDQVRYLLSTVERLGLPKDYINYIIPAHELEVIRSLRSGSEAEICLVEWKGTQYVLRLYHTNSLNPFPCSKMLPKLIHKNIVTFMGYCLFSDERSDRPGIIMELLGTDLQRFIRESQRVQEWNSPPFSEEVSWYIMKEIAQGMLYLHSKDIVHEDLKPANVLIKSYRDTSYQLDVKIADFGISKLETTHLADLEFRSVGTTCYRAPEISIIRTDNKTVDRKKADIYSYAITCAEILGADIQGDGGIIMNAFEITKGWRPKLPDVTSQDLKYFIPKCWHQDPSSRPDVSEICEYFSKHMAVQHQKPLDNNVLSKQRLKFRSPHSEMNAGGTFNGHGMGGGDTSAY